MKKKTARVINFINDLHECIVKDPQFRQNTQSRSETLIQAEIRPLIINYLKE